MYYNIFIVLLATLMQVSANEDYDKLFNSLQELKVKLNQQDRNVRELQKTVEENTERLEKFESGGTGIPLQTNYGFTVQRTGSYLQAPPETTIEFERIVTNHGGMWDRTSNTFISPVKGLYMFYLYVFRDSTGSYLDAFIVKDNVNLAMAHVNNGYPYSDSSVSLVVELEPLDRVYCRLSHGVLHSFTRSGPGLVHFSGFLISSIE